MQFRQEIWALAVVAALVGSPVRAADITGAGATFPYPIYAKWADAYRKASGVGLNYQSIGSGGGIKQITAKTVSFGASDAPMKAEDLDKNGLVQFPAIMGGIVPVYSLKGVAPGALKLSGAVLGDIYLGNVKMWNDPAIAKLNAGVALPSQAISVVHRSDGSGTTFLFSNFLSKVNPQWKSTIGEGTAVKWPTGVGGKGNEGVANYVARIDGSIGYVEYAYAKQNKMTYALLKNKDGNFVPPDADNFKAAAAGADWSKTFFQVLTDQPGKEAWPISGATFILVYKAPEKPVNIANALKFFDWAYANGDKMADDLEYVPLPAEVKALVRKAWAANLKAVAVTSK